MTGAAPWVAVTGAGSGIGLACAQAFRQAGWAVAALDRDRAALTALEVAGYATHAVDIAEAAQVAAVFDALAARGVTLRAAVNAAGIGADPAPTADLPLADWQRVLGVNLTGTFLCMQHQIRAMRAAGGAIVNIGSVASVVASSPGAAAYVAAKHGLLGLTRAAALDHAADGIRINLVGPGYIRTPLAEQRLGEAGLAAKAARHPLGRLGTPQEVAALCLWLCSPAAGFATGGFWPLDGGYTAI